MSADAPALSPLRRQGSRKAATWLDSCLLGAAFGRNQNQLAQRKARSNPFQTLRPRAPARDIIPFVLRTYAIIKEERKGSRKKCHPRVGMSPPRSTRRGRQPEAGKRRKAKTRSVAQPPSAGNQIGTSNRMIAEGPCRPRFELFNIVEQLPPGTALCVRMSETIPCR